jgi:hypothetical protein
MAKAGLNQGLLRHLPEKGRRRGRHTRQGPRATRANKKAAPDGAALE